MFLDVLKYGLIIQQLAHGAEIASSPEPPPQNFFRSSGYSIWILREVRPLIRRITSAIRPTRMPGNSPLLRTTMLTPAFGLPHRLAQSRANSDAVGQF
jgi:hypothetical protein